MKSWRKKLIKTVNPYLKKLGPVHDVDHSERVFKYCLMFARNYKNVDLDFLFAASFLHDCGQLERKRGQHGRSSVNFLNNLLERINSPRDKISLVKKIVICHEGKEISDKKAPIEAYIFRDADKIDGLGALGTARQLTYSGEVGRKIWDPTKKRNSSLPYGGNFSALHAVLDYHLKIKFYTKEGKKLADERKKYTRSFVKKFFQEWNFK